MEEKVTTKKATTKTAKPRAKKTTVKSEVKKTSGKTAKVVADTVSVQPKSSANQKVRIRVSAYEHKVLDQSIKQILDTALRHDAEVRGPIPLPTEIKKYTVNRSSFIDKNSREQFEMRIHRRLLDIMNPSPKIVESLANLNLPSGVNVDVKMM